MLVSCAIAQHDQGVCIKREADFPHWTCAYLYLGELDLRAGRARYRISAPAFFVIPPRLAYDFSVTVADEHVWAIFDASARIARQSEGFTSGVHVQPLSEETENRSDGIAVAMRQMLHHWQQEPMRVPLAENALERAMLLTFDRAHNERRYDERIALALNFIAKNWRMNVSVPQLAEIAHLSPSRFSTLFRKETGTTPAKYIEVTRLENACDLLLAGNGAISEIAEAVGFANAFHFSARFRANYGQSPRDFRRNPLRRRLVIVPEFPDNNQHGCR